MSEENMKQAPEKPAQKKKKKKGGRVPVALAAVLLVIALLFGVVVGYAFGRNTVRARLKEAQSQIDELSDAYEESSRNDDVFDAEMDVSNEEALIDLAGEGMESEGNDLLGGDELTAETAEETADEPVVVAEFDGGKVLSSEAAQIYEEEIALYAFAGYTEEEISEDLMGEVLTELVTDKVLHAKAEELGLDELSPEDEQEMAKLAQEDYDATVAMAENLLREEGAAEEGIYDAAVEYLKEDEGITYETVLEECRNDWWMSKLYDEAAKDVVVSDADIESAYNELVETQKESFTGSGEDYEYARMSGDVVAYNPAGYRAVRELLIAFDDETLMKAFALSEQIAALDASKQADEIARLEAELAECYASADARAEEALAQLKSGADFDEVLRAVNPDAADENQTAKVYPICEKSQYWPENVIGAAMTLENVGDVSDPIHVENGVAILVYDGEIAEGAVPLEEIREALRGELLESMQYGAYKAKVDEWVRAANPKYYPERMQ